MSTENSQQKKSKKGIVVVIIILLLAGAGILFWYLSQEEEASGRNLSSGLLPGSTEADYSDAASESIRIQINSRPEFEDGESEGNLYIGNPDPNQYDMEVIITLDETGEEVYNSGIIPPGYYIDNDKLDIVLEEGEHAALAEITYYTEDSGIQAKTNANITIVIGR